MEKEEILRIFGQPKHVVVHMEPTEYEIDGVAQPDRIWYWKTSEFDSLEKAMYYAFSLKDTGTGNPVLIGQPDGGFHYYESMMAYWRAKGWTIR